MFANNMCKHIPADTVSETAVEVGAGATAGVGVTEGAGGAVNCGMGARRDVVGLLQEKNQAF